MPNENIDKSVAAQTNTTVMGINFYIPFLEKLKLYQNFLRKQSFYQLNKLNYWEQEKVILLWAWSKAHQHLARYLNTRRLAEIYGYAKAANDQFVKIHGPEFEISRRDELIRKMRQDNFNMLEPIMGNLYLKGFAEVITYRDIVGILKDLKEVSEKEINKIFEYGLPFTVHSIIINQHGLLMGEVVYEEDKGKLWRYKLVLFLFYLFLMMAASVFIFTFLTQVFGLEMSNGMKTVLDLIKRYPSLIALITVSILFLLIRLWQKL